DWKPHYYGERGYARRARHGGRLGYGRGALPGASLCADWDACVYWRGDYDYSRRAAVFQDFRRTRDACLWIECDRAGAAGIYERTDSEDPSCVPGAAGFEAEYFAGGGKVAGGGGSRRRCGDAD